MKNKNLLKLAIVMIYMFANMNLSAQDSTANSDTSKSNAVKTLELKPSSISAIECFKDFNTFKNQETSYLFYGFCYSYYDYYFQHFFDYDELDYSYYSNKDFYYLIYLESPEPTQYFYCSTNLFRKLD